MTGVGLGTADVPFDQSQQLVDPTMGAVAEAPVPPISEGMMPPDVGAPQDTGLLAGVGGAEPGFDSGDLSDQDLSAMTGEEDEAAQLAAMLEDPSIPPNQKRMIEQQLALAARRRLGGI